MATETLPPDAIISSTNLSGAVTDIDEPIYTTANPVVFDGTNDYLNRGAGLTGAADSKLVTGSLWIKRGAISATQDLFTGNTGTTLCRLFFSSDNTFSITMPQTSGTTILSVKSSAITDTSNWHHIAFSFDMADTNKRHIYVDGVSDLATVTTYTNLDIDFTHSEWEVGSRSGGTVKYNGEMAELQVWQGTYLDLSVAANRELFMWSGKPIDPARAAAVLGTPIVLLSGPTDTWHTNQGGGDGFVENGALTDGTPLP